MANSPLSLQAVTKCEKTERRHPSLKSDGAEPETNINPSTKTSMSRDQIDKNDFLELEILNQVSESPRLTTRLIAAHLGCNIRLTHSLLKKLTSKGWLEVKKINSRNWNYYLTPQGLSEKAQRTYKFFEFSMQFYQSAREKSSQLCHKLSAENIKTIGFVGCGNLAEITYLSAQEHKLKLCEVYGENKTDFLGHPILSLNQLNQSQAEALIVCIYDKSHPIISTLTTLSDHRINWIF